MSEVVARVDIAKIRSHNTTTGYTVADVKFLSYEGENPKTNTPVIVGNFSSIFEGDEFIIHAKWVEHNIFGPQLRVSKAEKNLPRSKKGISEFIRKNVKGMGKVLSNRIVDELGENALSIIESDWERLSKIKGISEKKAKQIYDSLFFHQKFEPLAMFVLSHGGNYKMALWAYEEYGDFAIRKIRENPYVLTMSDARGFAISDSFAYSLGNSAYDEARIREAVLSYLNLCAENRGDLFVYKDEILKNLTAFVAERGSFGKPTDSERFEELIIQSIDDLLAAQKIIEEELDDSGTAIYLSHYFFMEQRIVSRLKELTSSKDMELVSSDRVDKWITNYEQSNNFTFAAKQKEAVHMALSGGVGILTGGPGTGKTQTINAVISCLLDSKPSAIIHLLAPTGKASKRITELTGMEAKTIHRAIGLGVGEDRHEIELGGELVVVDETSMMDVRVCYRLLYAIQEGVSVLFVGDVDQIPSVGAGLILRDLIESGVMPTVVLDEIFRQAQDSQIVMNAHRIISGHDTKHPNGVRWDHSKDDFFFIEKDNVLEVQQSIIASIERFIQKGREISEIQLLTPLHKGPLGVWNLNRLLQERFNPPTRNNKGIKLSDEISYIRVNDPVMHTVNNKTLDVFNGEVGIVQEVYVDVDRGEQVVVLYDDDKEVVYGLEDLVEIQLAYATSIHKSQGSEYPIVIIPIHKAVSSILNRNLLYTGLTRAKGIFVGIGDVNELDIAISKTEQMNRNSGIKRKLKNAFNVK